MAKSAEKLILHKCRQGTALTEHHGAKQNYLDVIIVELLWILWKFDINVLGAVI